jgi:arabinoxylan arabinofuranohydrolase
MTGDEPMFDQNGNIKTNTYGNITTLRVISSDDLVNWQDHGNIRAAGRQGAAKWAANSWAPCAAWKNIDGTDRFFLYFANSAVGIGVLTSDSPAGPFTDPLGKPLISRATPTCAAVTWLFDPAVLIDDDGTAYLYFGGGIPDGKAENPGTARAVRLGDDMISLDGDPVTISAPWLFEDSGINKFGDRYVYSYCSNFQVPSSGSKQGFYSGEIVYMISDDPLGPFTYAGRVLKNPGSYFGVGGNNHHCMFSFNGQWYITYHAATIDKQMKWNAGYRSTFVDVLRLNEKGLPALSEGTYSGVKQLRSFNPYRPVPASTAASMAGVNVLAIKDIQAAQSTASGGWIGISQVDFGDEGAASLSLRWISEKDGAVSILLDDWQAEPFAKISLNKTDAWKEEAFSLPQEISGTHDLYIRFSQPGILLEQWQFAK